MFPKFWDIRRRKLSKFVRIHLLLVSSAWFLITDGLWDFKIYVEPSIHE